MQLLSKQAAPRRMNSGLVMQFEDSVWCGRGDLNPHAFWAPPPQDGVSANFTTSARVGIHAEYNKSSRTLRGRSRTEVLC